MRTFLESAFGSQTRDEWKQVFMNTDSCVAPVLEPGEVQAQKGSSIPHAAPHLSRTPAKTPAPHVQRQVVTAGHHTLSVLRELGVSSEEVAVLERNKDIEVSKPGSAKL